MMTLKDNKILEKMLDRLFAALVNGPSLNARPHSSRQRIDFTQFRKLQDRALEDALKDLLSDKRETKFLAKVPMPKKRLRDADEEQVAAMTPEEQAAIRAYSDQQGVITKSRGIAEDAKSYENDTGVHVLQVGFPLLSLPPGTFGAARGSTRRVLAPICFIPLSMTIKAGSTPSITLECRCEGADLVTPNVALLAWIESQAGREIGELESDQEGAKPWDEVAQVVQRIAKMLDLQVPEQFASGEVIEKTLSLKPCPRADEEEAKSQIISSAVIGLFPLANEGLIRDTQAILAGEAVSGPIESFLHLSASLEQKEQAPQEPEAAPVEKRQRTFADERLVAPADPCQARAVKLARVSRGLVVHGPPGTGKSQTIANIIGDHLGRGQRVLFVCDKRTALDVVMNRVQAMGIGGLCAIVHDAQRDQRELYKSIREQLDNLSDTRTSGGAEDRIKQIDQELQRLHGELTEQHAALMHKPDARTPSFHEVMGAWAQLPAHPIEFKEAMLVGVSPQDLESQTRALQELFQRGIASDYANNPWVAAAGMALANFLAAPMDEIRSRMEACCRSGESLDQTSHPAIPPFGMDEDVIASAGLRVELAGRIKQLKDFAPAALKKWVETEPRITQQHSQRMVDLSKQAELIRQAPLHAELLAAVRGQMPAIGTINQQIVVIESYLASTKSFIGFLAFGIKKAASLVLAPFALPLSPESATRVRDFLLGLKARLLVQDVMGQFAGSTSPAAGLAPDEPLIAEVDRYSRLFAMLSSIETNPSLLPLRPLLANACTSAELLQQFIEGLEKSPARAKAIAEFEARMSGSFLFAESWLAQVRRQVRSGKLIVETLGDLRQRLGTMENVLRVREGLAQLPLEAMRVSATHLLGKSVEPDAGLAILMKSALALEISRRLLADPRLQSADSQRIQSTFERYISLESQKKLAAREAILHLWVEKQKERLLAGTGSRLNGAGADLRRRFTLRGERAMRLRQVIAVGQTVDDGDPLFDLRPVWMASPETVAQIFARKALFDVIVFDEASQCRLEEALPVLLRGQRVVIAGDPKQLPPTRFFESAVAASDQDDLDDDQQLFESQQGEIEDLLGAALNIEIEECYLDVHYRSRNSDLIEFSNEHFYGARLQPIPGHPANRARFAPLTLYKANGIYKDRQNEAEATRVCQIVRDLLRRAKQPSIGIACFNIAQRDLILEKLDELAETDKEFASALAVAWNRRSDGAFQGLFVKNLENVQGDERDHIIISTTYGPDSSGRFYHRFGPLGRAGGGRRLNVLVTRAREEVHIVTSIPESEYRQLPQIPPGQAPGGPWLLFSYLGFAERLADEYEQAHRILSAAQSDQKPTLNVRPTKSPSDFCKDLGGRLVNAHRTGADVFWGNDGFCIDLALQHPRRMEDVTIGVLCDMNRFQLAADPVEWEIFRTLILESQGWKLHRLWTPHFFRDQSGNVEVILNKVQTMLAAETDKDAIPVQPNRAS